MHKKIVIIGSGFAGRQACKALRHMASDVLVLDPSPVTTMLPALPDLAGGWIEERLVQHPMATHVPRNIQWIQQSVSSIDLDAGVVVANGQEWCYEVLLITPGSVPNFYSTPFPRDRMYGLGSVADALRIRENFTQYLQRAPFPHVVVSGTGYTGLELAMSLLFRAQAEGRKCAVTIVDPTPILLPSLPDRQRQFVLSFLTSAGAEVRMGVAVESFDGRDAVIGGTTCKDVFFCWAAGSKLAIEDIRGSVPRLRDGRLKVQPDLSLPGYANVFAAGDAAAIEYRGAPLRKAVNFAYYGGQHAGRNMARLLDGHPTRPFRPVDLGWIVPFHSTSIGRLPGGIWIRGRIGVRLHHLMCGLRNYSLANFAGCLQLALNPYKNGAHS